MLQNYLKEWRERAGLTTQEVDLRLHWEDQTTSNLEKVPFYNVPVSTLSLLSEVYGINSGESNLAIATAIRFLRKRKQ